MDGHQIESQAFSERVEIFARLQEAMTSLSILTKRYMNSAQEDVPQEALNEAKELQALIETLFEDWRRSRVRLVD